MMARMARLYRVESAGKDMEPEDRYALRQEQAQANHEPSHEQA